MDFEEANSQVNSLCGALPRDDLRMHTCIKSDISFDLEKRSIYLGHAPDEMYGLQPNLNCSTD